MTEIPFKGRERLILINGQTGDVEGDLSDAPDRTTTPERSNSGLMEWLADVLKDGR
jgi:hypothetical protein